MSDKPIESRNLYRQEVLLRLCRISSGVMRDRFDYVEAADCFCGSNPYGGWGGYRFGSDVMTFIEDAVREKLEREKLGEKTRGAQ